MGATSEQHFFEHPDHECDHTSAYCVERGEEFVAWLLGLGALGCDLWAAGDDIGLDWAAVACDGEVPEDILSIELPDPYRASIEDLVAYWETAR